jgi:hypothetical protein
LIKTGRAQGRTEDDIAEEVSGYLQGVKRISPLTENIVEELDQPKQFFINLNPTEIGDIFSDVRGPKTGKQAYYISADVADFKLAPRGAYTSVEEAFADGYDGAMNSQGALSINPKSKIVSRTPDMAMNTRFLLDLESGQLTRDAIITAADLMKKGNDFIHMSDAVAIAGKRYNMPASLRTSVEGNPIEQSARFMWAGKLSQKEFNSRTIEWDDFPLLDRAAQVNIIGDRAPSIHMPDGELLSWNELASAPAQINELKLRWLEAAANTLGSGDAPGWRDIRHWSIMLNQDRDWVERAISSNFRNTPELMKPVRGFEPYFRPQSVMATWDPAAKQANGLATMGPNIISSVTLGSKYRLEQLKLAAENAFTAVMGKDASRFMKLEEAMARTATSEGAGAGALSASNADYGSRARLAVQDLGKTVSLVQKENRDRTLAALSGHLVAIRDDKAASAELGILTTALRRDPAGYKLVKELAEYKLVDTRVLNLMKSNPELDMEGAISHMQAISEEGVKLRGLYQITSQKVADFLETSQMMNTERLDKRKVLFNSVGTVVNRDTGVIKVPAIDTARYPHHAFVVAKGGVGAETDVSMITARTPDQLRQLIEQLPEGYEAVLKEDTKRYFKAKGIYDHDMTLSESKVNSSMQRSGKLGDFYPETRAENVLEDYVRWHANAEDALVREAVQVRESQFFSELRWLEDRWGETAGSTFGGKGFFLKKTEANPFGDYVRTALNIPKRGEYPLLDSLNEFVDRTGVEMYRGFDAVRSAVFGKKESDSLLALEKANELMAQYGLKGPYENMESYLVANERVPKNLIRTAFQKANYVLATATLRLDLANALVNIVSTPIMLGTELSAIRSAVGRDSELAGKLTQLTTVKVPGQDQAVPGTVKLVGNAIKSYFGPNKTALLNEYRLTGDIKGNLSSLYHEVLDDLSYLPGRTPNAIVQKVNAAVEKGSKITGNDFAEELTRFISANVMDQLTAPLVAAGKMDLAEARAYRGSFVNRVQGNYITSQRPGFFQGTTGAAIGLFQTYAFNVFQQLFRHVENRDYRTLLTFGALQTQVYGLNGLPFFDAINQHLIGEAAGNSGHKDIYSVLPAANKELGDWMLYGTASAFPLFGDKSPALYSRGDINPRHLSIVPINPVDIPAVQASMRLVKSVTDFSKNVSKGGELTNSFLMALEHQGLNRPLAGFAQLLAGRATTSNGSLISAANDMQGLSFLAQIPERMVNYGGVARLMGAKPMDEAIALNSMYRSKAYDAVDRARIAALGTAVKTTLSENRMPSPEDMNEFMQSYVRSGGRIENFSSSLQHWSRDANQSVVNQITAHMQTPTSQRMMQAMGGVQLTDYRNQGVQDTTGEDQ